MSFSNRALTLLGLCVSIILVGCEPHQNSDSSVSNATILTMPKPMRELLARNTIPIHGAIDQAAVAKIPVNYHLVNSGYFTVAVIAGNSPPITTLALDNKTPIGIEVDVARLIAETLGLQLKLVPTSWEDWPLGINSGKYDAALINISVSKPRKERFDFVTYRKDSLGLFVAKDSPIQHISEAKDVAGQRVIVGAGTNQEKILLGWIDENKKNGLAPTTPVYFEDKAMAILAIESGRADVYFVPNPSGTWRMENGANIKRVGYLNGGWPKTADIAVTLKKGAGLDQAIQIAVNSNIKNGKMHAVLARWGLANEILEHSEINPSGFGE
ncbi:ABC transporter substrate-binding protein [Acinetobacter boissieri]|uniref:Amino acid ABC transporter substrate-binding protein, PAAT family n=1 Tax=Acinetobacter boissieri TaxID=1219383 RepID=A0A1G6H1V4_9GAMM|nr:ABC transporter substrate-binding protein [Acinetobacter boissieri]SDB87885.1 amino acid ABC transporter substrate-binding protein, PAAT family [Acinetobacter boissieri]